LGIQQTFTSFVLISFEQAVKLCSSLLCHSLVLLQLLAELPMSPLLVYAIGETPVKKMDPGAIMKHHFLELIYLAHFDKQQKIPIIELKSCVGSVNTFCNL